jgi:homoserine dehydrogenase
MKQYRLAFLGFGNVGKALGKLLLEKQAELRQRYDMEFTVTGIATGRRGKALNPSGIDLNLALQSANLAELAAAKAPESEFDFVRDCGADVLFETIPVNYATGQPALDLIRQALQQRLHVITANKGPVIHGYQELTRLAESVGRKFFFESTVMDGAPIFSLFRDALPGANLKSFTGVLNSTTNMILSLMERGESFEDSVAYCQKIGIAETDPSGDVDGWDAAIKVALLASVLMGVKIMPDQVDRTGIRGIGRQEIMMAEEGCKRWKLICSARRDGDRVSAKVAPEMVNMDSPLYQVDGTTSVVQFETDVLGMLSIRESDPGPHTTAYGMLADFLNAVKSG